MISRLNFSLHWLLLVNILIATSVRSRGFDDNKQPELENPHFRTHLALPDPDEFSTPEIASDNESDSEPPGSLDDAIPADLVTLVTHPQPDRPPMQRARRIAASPPASPTGQAGPQPVGALEDDVEIERKMAAQARRGCSSPWSCIKRHLCRWLGMAEDNDHA